MQPLLDTSSELAREQIYAGLSLLRRLLCKKQKELGDSGTTAEPKYKTYSKDYTKNYYTANREKLIPRSKESHALMTAAHPEDR